MFSITLPTTNDLNNSIIERRYKEEKERKKMINFFLIFIYFAALFAIKRKYRTEKAM